MVKLTIYLHANLTTCYIILRHDKYYTHIFVSLKLFQTPIIASIYTSGRNENNFTRANEFLPYRWDRSDPRKQGLANHVTSASLPFALGARSCVGKKIAMVQLSEIIKQVKVDFILSNFLFYPSTCGHSTVAKFYL